CNGFWFRYNTIAIPVKKNNNPTTPASSCRLPKCQKAPSNPRISGRKKYVFRDGSVFAEVGSASCPQTNILSIGLTPLIQFPSVKEPCPCWSFWRPAKFHRK